MIKQSLYFGNPAYLSLKKDQLVIDQIEKEATITRSIEDIGVVILDHARITITHNAMKALHDNKAVIISCDDHHMPSAIMLPMVGHSEQSKRYRIHQEVSIPLKKNLWQQTVISKINNQITVLRKAQKNTRRLEILVKRVQSGDSTNIEGQAAAYYWRTLMGDDFIRDRYGDPPNNLLNYGYAILRAMVARALCSSGLLLSLGIHHKNKYNPYCLADDIMEPYRPFVDLIAYQMYHRQELESFLTLESKKYLLSIGQMDAMFGKRKRPLMVGMSSTSSSLFDCMTGEKRKIIYPRL